MSSSHVLLIWLSLMIGVFSQSGYKEEFATRLMRELSNDEENVVFSPSSMDSTLSLVAYGAKGQTQQELFNALGYPSHQEKQLVAENQRNCERTSGETNWLSANRIMTAFDLSIKQEYLTEITKTFPGVVVSRFDSQQPSNTADEVNTWISQSTNNFIKNILDPSDINPSNRLILLNAVYFKGKWKYAFDKQNTMKECFYSEPGKCTMTDTMLTNGHFKYRHNTKLKAEIIELPYQNQQYSMIVVLPDQRNSNLQNWMINLDIDEIINFIDKKNGDVNLNIKLPKFEIEFKKDMKVPLYKIGIRSIFTGYADLSGMLNGTKSYIDSVIHKAKIICDEEGTVAAAATAIPVARGGFTRTVVVNRPFFFLIRSKSVGVLFTGSLLHPKDPKRSGLTNPLAQQDLFTTPTINRYSSMAPLLHRASSSALLLYQNYYTNALLAYQNYYSNGFSLSKL